MSEANVNDIQDLIIIKRRGSTEMEMPKGGVWKIAFADFMTAMMCFFLVMWLINAANEDTRQAVASYFNPIKLSEINPKGLRDPAVVPGGVRRGDKPGAPAEAGSGAGSGGNAAAERAALFRDPYAVLSDIAGSSGDLSPPASPSAAAAVPPSAASVAAAAPARPKPAAIAVPAATSDELRDPFDPQFRAFEPAAPETATVEEAAITPAEPAPGAAEAAEMSDDSGMLTAIAAAAPAAAAAPELSADPAPAVAEMSAAEPPDADATAAETIAPVASAPPTPREIARAALAAELADITGKDGASGEAGNGSDAAAPAAAQPPEPDLKVESTGEGTLISLTDSADFGMFAVGSAKPQAELIRIMARIAAVLKDRPGEVVIRGHTDARPFRTRGYDNWRLSTDRAQMAFYMLVRGGLDESRIESVEGYAARRLKDPADPEGAENRRIEILLKEEPA